jgi:hypothetical protein
MLNHIGDLALKYSVADDMCYTIESAMTVPKREFELQDLQWQQQLP